MMGKTRIKKLIVLSILVMLWNGLALSGIVNSMFLPSPLETLREGAAIFHERRIIFDTLSTFYRVFMGLAASFVIGIPAGILLGYYARLFDLLEWALDFFRSIPPILAFPLSLLIFGAGDQARVAVIFFGCVSIVILNSALGVIHSPGIRVHTAKIMGASWFQVLSRVVVFDALKQIFIGVRTALSMGIIIGIVTEMLVGARYGLGSRIIYAQTSYATAEMYVIILLVGLMGFFLNKLMVIMEKRIVHWDQI